MSDTSTLEIKPPVDYRSVSQAKQFLPELGGCKYQYFLQRRERVWQRPAAWFPQGTALHEAIEKYWKSEQTMTPADVHDAFEEAYNREVTRLSQDTPNWAFWFRSGPYDGERDIPRRRAIGHEQVDKYLRWVEDHPSIKPLVIVDQLAVELPFDVYFGKVRIKGFIDQLVKGGPIDVKSGNKPGDEFQLGTYAAAVKIQYGLDFDKGWFWMGKTGKLTVPFDLTEWPLERLTEIYEEVDDGIRAEDFEPSPERNKCMFCTVSAACKYAVG